MSAGLALSFVDLPASFCRGVERAAIDAGLLDPTGTPVTLATLRRTSESCRALDDLVRQEEGPVIALVSPFTSTEVGHALVHAAFAADLDGEPEQMLAVAAAAAVGMTRMPHDVALGLVSSLDEHGGVAVSSEEVNWLIALSRGATVVKLADDSGYSERALFRRLHDLYSRLGVANRAEALVAAERMGLLRVGAD